MSGKIKFRKGRIFLGIGFCALFLAVGFLFFLKPDTFKRGLLFIQILGLITLVLYSAYLYSLLSILPRKYAILITDEFLFDNSKYESLGKIKWEDISHIQRLKKNTIEVFLTKDIRKAEKRNLLKRFLRFISHGNYKKSILISSALLDCSIEELFETISKANKNYPVK